MPRNTSRSTSFGDFQYKILNKILHLNKILFLFGKFCSPLCFFCKLHDETLIYLLSSCNQVISLWIETKLFFPKHIKLRLLSPQIPTLSLVKGNSKSVLIQNTILMVFKHYLYKSRVWGTLNFNMFLHYLIKVNNLEKGAVFNNKQKVDMFLKKWSIVEKLLQQLKIFLLSTIWAITL